MWLLPKLDTNIEDTMLLLSRPHLFPSIRQLELQGTFGYNAWDNEPFKKTYIIEIYNLLIHTLKAILPRKKKPRKKLVVVKGLRIKAPLSKVKIEVAKLKEGRSSGGLAVLHVVIVAIVVAGTVVSLLQDSNEGDIRRKKVLVTKPGEINNTILILPWQGLGLLRSLGPGSILIV
ncbi:hypothetical protein QBC40DRAFT_302450 [Triangularia verruculosa]|uniref:Uncharacterized protein n=1 Tax=Triangularia verruculosa TaxID=2587418 RepID=A0AAN6X8J3_9PEZI|nr:hypothetical protein QBC40DRAFT_302450 [Triangularia verruculosa]